MRTSFSGKRERSPNLNCRRNFQMNSAVARIHFIASSLTTPSSTCTLALISSTDSADTDPLACAQISAKLRKTPGSLDQNEWLLRCGNRHGVVPEDLPLLSVERRGTTHERK